MNKSSNKKTAIFAVAVAALMLLMLMAYNVLKQQVTTGIKNITIDVSANDHESTVVFETSKEYLGEALTEGGLIKGENSEYGLFITEAEGISADASKQEWWCLTKGGEDVFTGVDVTPIQDGDHFELTLKTGW